jgi:hypothetical protein
MRHKKTLRDSTMQGRVREGGDHLAAFCKMSKRGASALSNIISERRKGHRYRLFPL